jgi:hypothetical protein
LPAPAIEKLVIQQLNQLAKTKPGLACPDGPLPSLADLEQALPTQDQVQAVNRLVKEVVYDSTDHKVAITLRPPNELVPTDDSAHHRKRKKPLRTSFTIQCPCDFPRPGTRAHYRVTSRVLPGATLFTGARVPRVARLMALAVRFEDLIRVGRIRDFADLARLGHVSRSRVTQIMNLRLLAPDIQELILFLPLTERGHDRIHLAQLQPIAREWDWQKQRRRWAALARSENSGPCIHNSLELGDHPR